MSSSKSVFLALVGILALAAISDGQLWNSHQLPAGVNDLSVLDHDADGDPDVLGGGNIRIMTNQLPDEWIYESYPLLPGSGGMAHDMHFLDLDEDGDLDVVYYGFDYDNAIGFHLGWLENLGNFEFAAHVIQEFDEGSQWNTLAAGDIDEDGDIDIVATIDTNGSPGLSVWYQQADQTWTSLQLSTVLNNSLSRLVDLNNDGLLDFACSEIDLGLQVWFSQPDGGFVPVLLRSLPGGPMTGEPKIIDFDLDGDPDLVTAHEAYINGNPDDYPSEITWWDNNGSGDFTEHVVYVEWTQGTTFKLVEPFDADNDGDTDIAFYSHLFINEGDNETFTQTQYTDVTSIQQLIAADIDNDGDIDLLNEDVRWFENPYIQVSVPEHKTPIPIVTELGESYPNPFNPTITIPFSLPERFDVKIRIYNMLGQQVATLVNRPMQAGHHTMMWDGRSDAGSMVASGVYFVRMDAPNFVQTRKIVMLK